MSRPAALQAFNETLHISASQITTFQTCSLKYRLQYVERRRPESIGIALPFGKAIHAALERYYRGLQQGTTESKETLVELFTEHLTGEVQGSDVPIAYNKKETPDLNAALDLGTRMLGVFHDEVDLGGYEILGVEMPMSATLYSGEANDTGFQLVGVIDLLLRSPSGELLCVDHKTSATQLSQAAVDDLPQFAAYAYLLAASGYAPPLANVSCRADILRKLKSAKFEQVLTTRTPQQRKRFAKIAEGVLQGIESRIYVPSKSWACSGCGYTRACAAW